MKNKEHEQQPHNKNNTYEHEHRRTNQRENKNQEIRTKNTINNRYVIRKPNQQRTITTLKNNEHLQRANPKNTHGK